MKLRDYHIRSFNKIQDLETKRKTLCKAVCESGLYEVNESGFVMKNNITIYNQIHLRHLHGFDSTLRQAIMSLMYDKVVEEFGDVMFDYIVFTIMGGVGLIDLKDKLPFASVVFVRNYVKTEGNQDKVLGVINETPNAKVLIVEDIYSSGGAVIETANALRGVLYGADYYSIAFQSNHNIWKKNFEDNNIKGTYLFDSIELTDMMDELNLLTPLGKELVYKDLEKRFK